MATLIGPDGEEYQISRATHRESGMGYVAFSDEHYAYQFLSLFADNYFNLVQLRQLAEELIDLGRPTTFSDRHLLRSLAFELVFGRIVVGNGETQSIRSGSPRTETTGNETRDEDDSDDSGDSASPPTDSDELTWIKFQVIDQESGEPVRGVTLKVKLTTGETVPKKTDGNGVIEFTDIPSGSCDIERMIDPESWEVVSVS